jgi:flagellar basal-body rod modification protein FlgD
MSSAVSSVTGSSSTTDSSANSSIPVPSQMLSQQDFLNLLVAQMTSQDPLNPMSNEDMLGQMVQFSTLSANTSMQSTLGQLQSTQEFSDATGLLGREVTLQVDSSTTAQGIVTGVDTSGTAPQVVVNGQSYDLSQVISVNNSTSTQ